MGRLRKMEENFDDIHLDQSYADAMEELRKNPGVGLSILFWIPVAFLILCGLLVLYATLFVWMVLGDKVMKRLKAAASKKNTVTIDELLQWTALFLLGMLALACCYMYTTNKFWR